MPDGNPLERAVRGVDAFQQRHTPTAFAFGVVKKFGDDRGSVLAALFAYYGFLSLFPLLLLLVTILGFVLGHDAHARDRVLNSALSEFPIIGDQLRTNIHSLHASGLALVVGVGGLVWGSLGLAQVGQYAMAQVWNVPGVVRPGFFPRLLRSLGLLAVLGVGVAVTSVVAGGSTGGNHLAIFTVLYTLLSVVLNIGIFVLAFRVLTPKQIPLRDLVVGSVVAGIGWTALQAVGGYLVGHQLKHSQQVYGLFAIVLGLIGFLALAGTLAVYAAEINVVRARRLWPRSIVQPPLTAADERVLGDIARQEERRPEQTVEVVYDTDGAG